MNKIYIVFSIIFLLGTRPLFSQDKPEIEIGGALRFNYNLSDWKEEQVKRGGDFGYDMFRVNAKVKYKNIKLDSEYRLYSQSFGGGMLKQGWVAYEWKDKNEVHVGLTQVPFGITQYNSHNWFFGINYYLGLEDDHDMGIKYIHDSEQYDFSLAFFKNAEELDFGSNSDVSDSRYSYDVSSIILEDKNQYRNKEVNQINGQFHYKINTNDWQHKIGVSAELGSLYNLDTQKFGSHHALAAHYELNKNNFNLKAQISKYQYQPKSPEGESKEVIAMTAYGTPYLVSAKGLTYTLGASYTIPVNRPLLSEIMFYYDFGFMDKLNDNFQNSIMNVAGAMLTSGPVYTYIDFAFGKNHSWLGEEWTRAFAQGNPDNPWGLRFNINLGYYF